MAESKESHTPQESTPPKPVIRAVTNVRMRYMTDADMSKVHKIARKMSLYVPLKEMERVFIDGKLKVLVAATTTGEVKGTCWIMSLSDECSLISGLELETDVSQCNETLRSLFNEVIASVSGKKIYINFLAGGFINETHFAKQFDIHLYYCHTSELLIPIIDSGDEFTISMGKTSNIETETAFLLRVGGKDVGYAALFHYEKGNHWIIGPVAAPNDKAAVSLLRRTLLYIKENKLIGQISMYIIATNDTRRTILERCGFKKSKDEWTRYSSIKPLIDESALTFKNFAATGTFALQSLCLSAF